MQYARLLTLCLVTFIAASFPGCYFDTHDECEGSWCEDDPYPPYPEEEEECTEVGDFSEQAYHDYDCDDQDPGDSCQEAICVGVEEVIDAFYDCEYHNCGCTHLDGCLAQFIDCVDDACPAGLEPHGGELVECALDLGECIDP